MLTNILAQAPPKKPMPIRFESKRNQHQRWLFTTASDERRPVILILKGSVGADGDVLGIGQALPAN